MSAVSDVLPVALRDTALTVSDLYQASGRSSEWAKQVLKNCIDQIAHLKAELRTRGLSPDQIDDAVCAQCALLDEVALRNLEGDARNEWERNPLQLAELKVNDAGEELVRRIEQRLHDAQPTGLLLAIFASVLDLGFTGRLALDGHDARARLRRALDERLGVTSQSDDSNEDGAVIVRAPVTRTWGQRISPLGCVALACVAMSLIWFAIDSWLDASVRAMH